MATFLEELRGGRAAPEGLQPLLPEVLNLPDLDIYYVVPEEAGRFVDSAGFDVSLDQSDGRVYSSVDRAGTRLAVVAYSTSVASSLQTGQSARVDEVLDRAGLAIEIALTLRHAQHELGPSPVNRTLEDAVREIGAARRRRRIRARSTRRCPSADSHRPDRPTVQSVRTPTASPRIDGRKTDERRHRPAPDRQRTNRRGHVRGVLIKLDIAEDHDSHRRVLAVLALLRASGAPVT